MDTFLVLVSAILVGFTFANFFASVILIGFARKAKWKLPALNERAITTGIKTVGTFLLGVLGANRIFDWHMSEPLVLSLLSVAVILHSLPPVIWLWYYKTGRFSQSENFQIEE
jgi:hypothetical protein